MYRRVQRFRVTMVLPTQSVDKIPGPTPFFRGVQTEIGWGQGGWRGLGSDQVSGGKFRPGKVRVSNPGVGLYGVVCLSCGTC